MECAQCKTVKADLSSRETDLSLHGMLNSGDEVLAHLSGLVGAKVTVTLEIEVEVPDRIPEDKVRIVSENASTLQFKPTEFDV